MGAMQLQIGREGEIKERGALYQIERDYEKHTGRDKILRQAGRQTVTKHWHIGEEN